MGSFGARLKEERKRLGHSQKDLGAIGGVQAQAQLKYEKGERSPDAEYLAALAATGIDVKFVLTGERSHSPSTDSSIAPIDLQFLLSIASQLDKALAETQKPATPLQLIESAVEVYNFLAGEAGAVDDEKIARVIRLVATR